MESLSVAISAPPELPRSKMRSTSIAVLGRARSRATRRRTYSARDTPSSLALCRARRCTSLSSVICVRDIMMAPSYQHGLLFLKCDDLYARRGRPSVADPVIGAHHMLAAHLNYQCGQPRRTSPDSARAGKTRPTPTHAA